jgi:hypothetical protein
MSDLIKHYRQLLGIAKNWAERNIAGWCADTHRDLLARHGAVMVEGRVTASSMNMPQLAAALEDYERRGWIRQKGYAAKGAQQSTHKEVPPRIANMFKLWGKLGQAGKVNNETRAGLLSFCARQTKREIRSLDDLSVVECQGIIEALKNWFAR